MRGTPIPKRKPRPGPDGTPTNRPARGPGNAPDPAGESAPPRLQLVLARAGVASRRDAEDLIRAGRVAVDGTVVRELGTRVDTARHRVTVDGRPLPTPVAARYLALNKPTGYLATADDPGGRPTVMQLVPPVPGLFPVGRLDADSEGLILFTTDGNWAQRAAHPRYGCQKEYDVDVTGHVTPEAVATMRGPMVIGPDDRTTGSRVDVLFASRQRGHLRVTLHEGRHRQVRRMCALVGLEVIRLVRVRVGGVALGSLAPGEWRNLTEPEVASIARQPRVAPPASIRGATRRSAEASVNGRAGRALTGAPVTAPARPARRQAASPPWRQ